MAAPLKKAVYITGGQTIRLNYHNDCKKTKGFEMYFSAADYSIILFAKQRKVIDKQTIGYRGSLLVRCGRQKYRYAVHGVHVS
ncbi:hypothetical protein [Dyadobacter jiangsuensis]|uniref:hypothetical protein n=1 Tax=Dyadobacter jiangsuensis TaxID=1591085 RepID=UPI000D0CB062|nr:hypothetical protein [Dyadobacter jiangsuensis]